MLHQTLESGDAAKLILLKINEEGIVSVDYCDTVEVSDISYAAHFLTHFVMQQLAGGEDDE